MAITVGSVYVDLLPSSDRFSSEADKQLKGQVETIGKKIAEELGKSIAKGVSKGVEDGVSEADPEGDSAKQGEKTGGAFAKTFKATLKAALANLPEIELKADTKPALRNVAALRKEIGKLAAKIDVDVNAQKSLADLEKIRRELAFVAQNGETLDIRINATEALAGVEEFQKRIRSALAKSSDEAGKFARDLNAKITAAVKTLPDIKLNANADVVEFELKKIRGELQALGDQRIGIDISVDDAYAKAVAKLNQLREIAARENISIDIKTNAIAAATEVEGFIKSIDDLKRNGGVEVPIKPDLGRFETDIKAAAAAAAKSLPDFPIRADARPFEADLARVKNDLKRIGDIRIGVDFSEAEVIGSLESIKAELDAINRDAVTVQMKADTATASAEVDKFLAKIRGQEVVVSVKPNSGAFATELRAAVDAARKSLPDIVVNADTSAVDRQIAFVNTQLAELQNVTIGVDVSDTEALRKLEDLRANIAFIASSDPSVQVQVDTARALAAIDAFVAKIRKEEATVTVAPEVKNLGAFTTKLQADLKKIAATLAPIDVQASTSVPLAEVEVLRKKLAGLSAKIGVELDAGQALAEAATIEAALKQLDTRNVDISVKLDIAKALADLAALAAAAEATSGSLAGVGDSGSSGMSRLRLIMIAVLALFPVVAGAVVSLAGAISLIAAPVAAVALGIDGIKAAFAPLQAQFATLKTSISNVFQVQLAQSVTAVQKLLPVLTTGLENVASALSGMANGVLNVVSSSAGMKQVTSIFDKVDITIRNLTPAVDSLVKNFLSLADIGLTGLQGFGTEMTAVGDEWTAMISRISGSSGVGVVAVRSFFDILSQLLGLIAPLTEFGAVLLAAFGPAIGVALTAVGDVLKIISAALTSLPQPVQTVIAVLTTLKLVSLAVAGGMRGMATAMVSPLTGAIARVGTGFTTMLASFRAAPGVMAAARVAIAGIGASFKALWLAIGGLPGLILIGLVTALSLLGQGNEDAAAAEDAHKQAAEQLAQALQESGNAINDNIVNLTRAKLEQAGFTDEQLKSVGGINQVASVIAHGGAAYDLLRQNLQGVIAAHTAAVQGVDRFGNATSTTAGVVDAEGVAAQKLLDQLGPLRKEFTDAAEQNRLLGQSLLTVGDSLVNGVGSAADYQKSLDTLKDTMSSVEDRANALHDALIILSGGTLPLLEANAHLQQSIEDMGAAFEATKKPVEEGGGAFLDASGNINIATDSGRKFVDAYSGAFSAMTDAAAAAFQAAGGLDNLDASSKAASDKAQQLRDVLIQEVLPSFHGNKQAANDFADSLGLIPSEVSVLISAKSIPQVQAELQELQTHIDTLKPGVSFTVQALTADSEKALTALGFTVTHFNGEVQITANDKQAVTKYDDFVRTLLTNSGNGPIQVPVGANTAPATKAIPGLANTIAGTSQINIPTALNTTQVPAQAAGVQQTVQSVPATVPTNLDTSKVPAQAAAIAQTVTQSVATIPINPIKGSGWDADLAAIVASVLVTVAKLPMTVVKSPTFDADLQAIRDAITNSVPAILYVEPLKSVNFETNLDGLKTLVSTDIATMFIDAAKSVNFDAQILAIKTLLAAPPYFALPIDVVKSPTFDIDLQVIIASLTTPLIPLKLDLDPALANTKFLALLQQISLTIVAFHLDADPALAIAIIGNLFTAIEGSIIPFQLALDPTIAVQQLEQLIQIIESLRIPLTIVLQITGGLVGGGGAPAGGGGGQVLTAANGTFLTAGTYMAGVRQTSAAYAMATGGMLKAMASGGGLTPMSGKYATVVPPNTWRVVGDNLTHPEAFIPLNGSDRSKGILAKTAAAMNFGLIPLADGAVATQQAGAYSAVASNSSSSNTFNDVQAGSGRGGDTYNFPTTNSGATALDLADEVMFRLRHQKTGGPYSGRR